MYTILYIIFHRIVPVDFLPVIDLVEPLRAQPGTGAVQGAAAAALLKGLQKVPFPWNFGGDLVNNNLKQRLF